MCGKRARENVTVLRLVHDVTEFRELDNLPFPADRFHGFQQRRGEFLRFFDLTQGEPDRARPDM